MTVIRTGMKQFLLVLVWAALITPSASGAEVDRSKLIVRLKPSSSGPVKIAKGRSGRLDFDRVLGQYQSTQLQQVLVPGTVPPRNQATAEHFRLFDFVVVTVPPAVDPDALSAALARSPDVELVAFAGIVHAVGGALLPNDPYFSTMQYALSNNGTQPGYDPGTADADIDMDDGWQYTTGDSATVLAILDTGIDFAHPEFSGRIWLNPDEEFDEIDNDGNGYVDDGFGWNFAYANNTPSDGHGHGTHVSGIAAATGNNGVGVAGINWACRIMPLKVLGDQGSGSDVNVAAGIIYAANEGADVISMSLGSPSSSAVESTAIAYAESLGVVIVAAMGNDDVGSTFYPAAYDSVISVGATDSDDRRADPFCYSSLSGSNYGPWIDVCAPGENVWNTYIVGFGSYSNLCGTSMATPHVSGLVSLILGLRPGYPADSVRRLLRLSADDQVGRPTEDTPGFDVYHGWGRINAARALRAMAIVFSPEIVAPPAVSTTEGDTLEFLINASDSNLTVPTIAASPALSNATFVDHGDGTATLTFLPDYDQEGIYTLTFIASDGELADTTETQITVAHGCVCPCYGDPVCDSQTDIVDVINTIAVAFRGEGVTIDPNCDPNPGGRTDLDCSGATDIVDVVSMINVAFRGEAANFCNPCTL